MKNFNVIYSGTIPRGMIDNVAVCTTGFATSSHDCLFYFDIYAMKSQMYQKSSGSGKLVAFSKWRNLAVLSINLFSDLIIANVNEKNWTIESKFRVKGGYARSVRCAMDDCGTMIVYYGTWNNIEIFDASRAKPTNITKHKLDNRRKKNSVFVARLLIVGSKQIFVMELRKEDGSQLASPAYFMTPSMLDFSNAKQSIFGKLFNKK